MIYTDSSYEKYLKILKISRRNPSIGALTQLISAHLTTIPFENISKIYYKINYGLKNIPDLDLYLFGISKNNFGGTCYSNNYYLNKLLNYLGYEVRLCGVDMANPDVHLVNIVRIESKDYLVDAGYAAPFLKPIPLDLTKEYKIALGANEYIISPRSENGYSELKMIRNGQPKHGYTVKPYSRSISEFETVIKNSFKESALFLNTILLTLFKAKSSIMIHNFSLVKNYCSKSKSIKLKSKEELIDNIVRYFAIPKYIVEDSVAYITNFDDAWN